jgi:hypothetical protein
MAMEYVVQRLETDDVVLIDLPGQAVEVEVMDAGNQPRLTTR